MKHLKLDGNTEVAVERSTFRITVRLGGLGVRELVPKKKFEPEICPSCHHLVCERLIHYDGFGNGVECEYGSPKEVCSNCKETVYNSREHRIGYHGTKYFCVYKLRRDRHRAACVDPFCGGCLD